MRSISADDIDRLLSFPDLVDALGAGFAGTIVTPVRHHHAIGAAEPHSYHLLMPCWTGDAPGAGAFLGTKIVNVFPGNGAAGLPAVQGVYLLMSGETGAPLAVMDGTRLTLWRTAATSALAARSLARDDATRLTMVGAGALAPFLIRAHASQRPLSSVTLWNKTPARAEALATSLAGTGIDVRVETDLERAVSDADIVSCATLSETALVRGAWLKAGSHLDLVGAFTLAMREADDEALRRGTVYIDSEAALSEGGDVAQALQSGAIGRDHVRGTLTDLALGRAPGRTDAQERTVFKSVGTALTDLCAAMLVWTKAGH